MVPLCGPIGAGRLPSPTLLDCRARGLEPPGAAAVPAGPRAGCRRRPGGRWRDRSCYGTPCRGQSVPRPGSAVAMLALLRLPCSPVKGPANGLPVRARGFCPLGWPRPDLRLICHPCLAGPGEPGPRKRRLRCCSPAAVKPRPSDGLKGRMNGRKGRP